MEPFLIGSRTFALFDPLGGVPGERIVAIALEAFRHATRRDPDNLRGALAAANTAVHDAIRADGTLRGAGCTAAALALSPSAATVAWTGDVHVLLLRAGRVTTLTQEHSLVHDHVAKGVVAADDEGVAAIPRGVIVQALGMQATVAIDCITTSTEPGDVFVLASSGLREALGDGLLASTLLVHRPDARALARALLDEASANGGRDTLTVVVVGTSEDGELSPTGASAHGPRAR
jgi:protein phosphatase